MIVDSHVHIADELDGLTGAGATRSLLYGRARWGADEFQFLTPCSNPTAFSAETLVRHLDWAGVDRAVVLQGPFYGDKNSVVAAAVEQWPDRLVGAGYFDPCVPEAERALRRCIDDFGFRILKLELSVATGLVGLHPELRIDDEAHAWIWDAVEKEGIVVVLDLGAAGSASYQTPGVEKVLERHPALRVVIAHLAQPPIAHPDDSRLDELWEEQLRLGLRPNVWFDLASLPAYASMIEDYPFPTACTYIERAARLLGADKLLWGTDIPGVLTAATYPQLRSYLTHCHFLTDAERARVLGENAARVFSIG